MNRVALWIGLAAGMAVVVAGCGGSSRTPASFPTGTSILPDLAAGSRLFVESGCLNCHTFLSEGKRRAGAPDLSAEGSKDRGLPFQIAHLKCPSCATPGSTMPSYTSLGATRLRQLALFLEASLGLRNTESLENQNIRKVPPWIQREHLPPGARPGARLFAEIGCLNCHTYLGTGGGFKGAPDLSAEGRKHRGVSWQIRHLRCPACLVRGSPMPSFTALGAKRIRELAIFLEASKGAK